VLPAVEHDPYQRSYRHPGQEDSGPPNQSIHVLTP
jgi:hypothetical protein